MPNPVEGFPDATNTGVPNGTNLSAYDGPMTITTPGTVIDGKTINGPLVVAADDVVIKNCSIKFNSWWGIDAEGAKNITVQNCDIVGPGTSGDSNSGILGSGKFIGNNISSVENGITLTDGSSTVKGNFIHDLADGGNDPHYDGISVQGRQDGVLIEGNTIAGRDTSDVFIKNDFGAINDVSVHHNLLIGDPGYNVYVDGRADGGAITNVSITDNYVQEGFYGTYSVDKSSPEISGNVEFAKGETPSGQTASSTDPTPPDDTPATGTTDPSGGDNQHADSGSGTSTGSPDTGTGSGSTGGQDTGSGSGSTGGQHTTPGSGSGSGSTDGQHTAPDPGSTGGQDPAPGTGSTGGHDTAPDSGSTGGKDASSDGGSSGSGSQDTTPDADNSGSGRHHHSGGDSFNWGNDRDHGGHSSGSYSHARHSWSDWSHDRAGAADSGESDSSGGDFSWQDFHHQWSEGHHWGGADHFTL